MLYYKKDNTVYNNRKELRQKIGLNEYKRECKRGNVVFLNPKDDNTNSQN